MTTPHPLPAEGGSYLRNPDGSLARLDPPVTEAPAEPAPAKAVKPEKTPVKGA